MDQLWEVAERDLHDGPSGDEGIGYNRNEERMEVDDEQKEEGEEVEENEENEETGSWDDDAEGQHSQDEEEQPQSMKRYRRKRPRQDSSGDSGGPSAEQGESEEGFEGGDGNQEVIEIFDDDEEARSSTGRGSRGCELSDFPSPLPPADNPAATASATAAMEPSRPFTTAVVARAGDLFSQTGVSPYPTSNFGPTSSSSSSNSSSTKKDACSDPTGTSRVEPSQQPARKPSLLESPRHAWRSGVVLPRARSPLGEARGEGKKYGNRLGEKMPVAKQSWNEARGSGEQSAEAELSSGQASSRLVRLKVPLANNTPATRAATATTTASEFPENLECPMCFHPLAVVALFACGHGACWECAHDWCGRGATPTMDCPTCHVSIPRNGFRQCIVLDQVVENAVTTSGLDDAEWHGRLQRGRGMARRAEASRRSASEVQRSAEETIAKQAAELERLRQEKSRSLGRGRRSYEGFSPPMADFGFHLVGSGHDRLESSSATASPGTSSFDDSLFRPRHPRTEPAASVSRGEAAAAATAAAAASLRVLPSDPGGVHPRLQASSSSSFGLAMDNPWCSLRPSLSSRQHPGVSTSAMRLGHEAYGRSSASTRSYSSPIVPGGDPAAGAALKSEHERRYPTGQHRAHPSRPSGSAADDAVTPGARARNAALSSLYAFLPRGAPVSFDSEDMRNSAMSGATLPPGRRFPPQVPSARSSRKRYSPRSSPRGMSASAAAMSIAGATASSSSSSFSTEAGSAAVATSAAVGSPTPPDRFSLGSPGNDLAVSRFERADSDLDALDVIFRHEDSGARPSDWDDVLAAVSMPLQESDDSQPKTRG